EGPGTVDAAGTWRWVPEHAGVFEVKLEVDDGDGGKTPISFEVTVDPLVVSVESCGCGSTAPSSALGWAGMLALVFLLRGRRRLART
ncbi:MAG: MYXO-CTERM sorting domain-containing protein, partial [Myxococcales bacterium]